MEKTILKEEILSKKVEEEKAEELNRFSLHSYHKAIYNQNNFTAPISTGFEQLDNALDGGLYPRLHVVGAVSSLGTTTFVLQVADQITTMGHDVIYISCEMTGEELTSKIISKYTYLFCKDNDIDTSNAKTSRGITDLSRYKKYNTIEQSVINEAIKNSEYNCKNLFFYDNRETANLENLESTIKEHIKIRKKNPIIIIDYLQIVPPIDPRKTDKQNIDNYVIGLKELTNKYNIPIIAISSFNRENYSQRATMQSFKESGAIEYSSDVLIALQPNGMTDEKSSRETMQKCKEATEREIELCILKNRNGRIKSGIVFTYYTLFNYFEERPFNPTYENLGNGTNNKRQKTIVI